VLEIASEGLFR